MWIMLNSRGQEGFANRFHSLLAKDVEKTVLLFHNESTFQSNDDQPILNGLKRVQQ